MLIGIAMTGWIVLAVKQFARINSFSLRGLLQMSERMVIFQVFGNSPGAISGLPGVATLDSAFLFHIIRRIYELKYAISRSLAKDSTCKLLRVRNQNDAGQYGWLCLHNDDIYDESLTPHNNDH